MEVNTNTVEEKHYVKGILSIKNLGVFIYIMVNFILFLGVADLFFSEQKAYFNLSVVIYFSVMALSLLRLGDMVTRILYKAEKADKRSVVYVYFEDIIFRASDKNFAQTDYNIELYFSDKIDTYVKAVSRKTIILNRDFLKLEDFQQQALLAKELGIIIEKGIYLEMVMKVSNFVYFLLFLIYKCYYLIITALCMMAISVVGGSRNNSDNSFLASFGLATLITLFFEKLKSFGVFMKNLLIRSYLRDREFKTDIFAVKIGLKNEIIDLLRSYNYTGEKTSMFRILPSIYEREENLKKFIAGEF
ncbi:hypothetical protein [Anaerotignum propionicum]|uniref:Uncharacterized protein n=1 Tax=Anaerotignum propionicum DSM 1682 TaxID=991789 RepID=A0A0X8VBA9_ANAPI|nr:hypothetical protein [Anaerotignum propionicum]AMJ39774.1 hypothetical protein CPRO_01500 [Anaerotignum propionicum DSM 1682]SHE28744.1 hypothetical protein SAMN02745151_00203 [[Clostridium] propionicum DSM 1682] [Anaerotignum propionicum DSM 1682]